MFRSSLRVKGKRHGDYLIMICLALLVVFGLIMLSSASSSLGKAKFGDSFYFLKHQAKYGLTFGLVLFLLTSRIYYRRYEKLAFLMLILSVLLLALVYTPLGVSSKGAARWLALGPIVFQPSELVKLFFIIYLASWLSRRNERQQSFWHGWLPFLIIMVIVAGLLLKQPATSTVAILVSTALVIYFISGAKLSYIFSLFVLLAVALAGVIIITPYRYERLVNFLKPEENAQTGGFHINQALIAIGSGGLTGVGYGQSTSKLSYLPEPAGDSIFAVIAEELGFIGAGVLIAIFLILILRIFLLAKKCRDKFGQLLLAGFGSLIAIQAFVNVAAISGLIPLTGTPLPFISYGGTALAVFMAMGGIVVNISKYV